MIEYSSDFFYSNTDNMYKISDEFYEKYKNNDENFQNFVEQELLKLNYINKQKILIDNEVTRDLKIKKIEQCKKNIKFIIFVSIILLFIFSFDISIKKPLYYFYLKEEIMGVQSDFRVFLSEILLGALICIALYSVIFIVISFYLEIKRLKKEKDDAKNFQQFYEVLKEIYNNLEK